MANWSQSHFLQSLGWAILNSFWQMALLWFVYLISTNAFLIKSNKKYQFAVAAVITGFAWFLLTFIFFFTTKQESSWAIFNQTIDQNHHLLQYFLLSASLTYLGLLIFPSYRLLQNWRFVQRIKKDGLHKAELNYRLFVQRVAAQIGITKKVLVHVSDFVSSPLTIGYLKPIILLPAAAFSNLTPQQVEAVLLHELSHIRRYDYIVNFILSIIHTLLYFNPFVKNFIRVIEDERETCCDELVLQFGYDKVGYASALITLEKISVRPTALAIAATGKNSLLHRIENIVGMEKKKLFRRTQIAGMIAALFCIIAFNSVMIIKEKKALAKGNTLGYIGNPFALFQADAENIIDYRTTPSDIIKSDIAVNHTPTAVPVQTTSPEPYYNQSPIAPPAVAYYEEAPASDYMQVSGDEVDNSLTSEQKEQVATAVSTTKKVVGNLQWKEIEKQIGDVLTQNEKAIAQKEYNKELEQINWKNIEKNLKAQYEKVDWNQLNAKLVQAENIITIDSLHQVYSTTLSVLNKAEKELLESKSSCSPIPDVSVCELQKAKAELKTHVEVLKALRNNKKVIRL